MASSLAQSLLNSAVVPLETEYTFKTMDSEQFAVITAAIEVIRKKVENKEPISTEECRLIVVYFRERRGRAFTVKKAPAPKKTPTKTLPKKRETGKSEEIKKAKKLDTVDLLDFLKL